MVWLSKNISTNSDMIFIISCLSKRSEIWEFFLEYLLYNLLASKLILKFQKIIGMLIEVLIYSFYLLIVLDSFRWSLGGSWDGLRWVLGGS